MSNRTNGNNSHKIIVLVSPFVSSLVCMTVTPCRYLINNGLLVIYPMERQKTNLETLLSFIEKKRKIDVFC